VDLEVLATGLGFVEGPVQLPDGDVAVASITEGAVFRLAPDGAVRARIETGGGPNGLAVDADGAIYVAQNGGIWGGRPVPSRACSGSSAIGSRPSSTPRWTRPTTSASGPTAGCT
jgi:hypothetical protein